MIKKKKILIMGLPGAGKTTLAKYLVKLLISTENYDKKVSLEVINFSSLLVGALSTNNLRKDEPYIIYEGIFNPMKNPKGLKFVSGEEFFKYLKVRD